MPKSSEGQIIII